MKKIYDLAISIVVYDPDKEWLLKTINSCLGNKDLDLVISVWDNSKTSLSFDLPNDPRIKYHFNRGKNLGFGGAHNKNFLRVGEDAYYYLALNPDIMFDSNLLTKMLLNMTKDTTVGLSIPKICYSSGEIQRVNRRLPRPQDCFFNYVSNKISFTKPFLAPLCNHYLLKDIDLEEPFECPVISGCFMLFKSELFKKVGGFDERFFLYLEDTDIARRLSSIARTVVFSEAVAIHKWAQASHINLRMLITQIVSMVRYFNKWGWFFDEERTKMNRSVCYYQPRSIETTKKRPETASPRPRLAT